MNYYVLILASYTYLKQKKYKICLFIWTYRTRLTETDPASRLAIVAKAGKERLIIVVAPGL